MRRVMKSSRDRIILPWLLSFAYIVRTMRGLGGACCVAWVCELQGLGAVRGFVYEDLALYAALVGECAVALCTLVLNDHSSRVSPLRLCALAVWECMQ